MYIYICVCPRVRLAYNELYSENDKNIAFRDWKRVGWELGGRGKEGERGRDRGRQGKRYKEKKEGG